MKHILIITLLFSFSCAEDTTDETKPPSRQAQEIARKASNAEEVKGLKKSILTDDGVDESEISEGSEFAFRFPSINKVSCSETIQPELCEWGKAADDIVLLEVTDVSFVSSPIMDSRTGNIIQTCDGGLFPALKIEGVIGESVQGSAGPISVTLGYGQYKRWNVYPYLNGLQKLTWTYDVLKIDNGSQIGLTLHKNPTTEAYSVLGEPFFQIDPDNKIEFSDFPEKCGALEPRTVSGKTFIELKEQLRNCPMPSTTVSV